MDERVLPEPIVREGEIEEQISEAAQEGISSEDMLNEVIELWNDDAEELFPFMQETEQEEIIPEAAHPAVSPELDERDVPVTTMPERESGESIPNAPLWMQPDDLQQEEVKAQNALMRDVVATMLPASDAMWEVNAASEIALLQADEISRIEELAWSDDLERGSEVALGDE